MLSDFVGSGVSMFSDYCGLVWSKGTKFKGIDKIISTYILRGGEERLRDTYIM